MFWFSVKLSSETFLILRRIQRDIVINVETSSCNVPVIFVRFSRKLEFVDTFLKKSQMLNFIKIRLVGAQLFYADGHDEAKIRFSKFCERAWKAKAVPLLSK